MTDETAGTYAGPTAKVRRWLQALPWPTPGCIGQRAALVVAAALIGFTAWHFWHTEGTPINVLYTIATTLTLVSLVLLATRRVLFSVALVLSFVALIHFVASIKRRIMDMVVHAYDIFFYLSSWSTISYLWSDHRRYIVGFVVGVGAIVALAAFAYRVDGSRISRRLAALFVLVSFSTATAGALLKEERRHMQFYFDNLYISSFYASWAETAETLWRGQLVEAAREANGPRFAIPTDCGDQPTGPVKRPHILLIHQESVVPPALFPSLAYDKRVDPLFNSFDGTMHKLRVETYGGASWLTEFSLLTGISTHSFGGMRQFVQTVMENRVRDTLPQGLARCGYRNVVFYPMLKNFVSNARFYQSVGLNEIFDLKDQRATRSNERDHFYYDNALAEMARHVKASTQPLFLFIQTMAAHWPYDVTYDPQVDVAGGGPGTDPEMHEYLRRVSMAKVDYDYLKGELKRRFPNEPVLIVHYGDHQPTATRTLLGFGQEADAEDVIGAPGSPAYTTYYAVEALNWSPTALPRIDTVDVAYLGNIILDAARVPLSPAMTERKRLMGICDGHYFACKQRGEVLAFHRRLIDSKIMDAR